MGQRGPGEGAPPVPKYPLFRKHFNLANDAVQRRLERIARGLLVADYQRAGQCCDRGRRIR